MCDRVREPNDVSMLHEIFIAMVNHQDDAHIQETGCRAVSRLLDNSPSVVSLIGEDEEQLSIHNSVFAAMNIHIKDPYVFQASCAALHDLATASSRLQQFLVARGCYVTIVDHMRENINDAAIQEWGFRALRALCSENVLQEEVLIKYDLLTDIRKTLHVFADNTGVLEEALSLLACMAADMDIVRRQCLLELTHDRVVEIMNAHKGAIPLLKICFEILAVFAASEEQEILCGVLGAVEEVMRKYKFEKDLQLTGCILTQLLASMAICENYVACSNSVSLISEALINFPSDVEVQSEAVVAMKVLAELENGLKAIIHLNAYEHLFAILNSKALPSDILEISAESLMIIGSNPENSDRMLQWALVRGCKKEAEWLLGIGADIDGATQNKSNVIIAAETSNYKMMKFLLDNGASHTQEALKISQSKSDSIMIGILLRQIGLERKGDTLVWSNLNISELQTEYFTSSFIEETDGHEETFQGDDWANYFETAAARRKQRFSSLDFSFESLSEDSGSEEQATSSPKIQVSRERPRSSSGALLPFNSLDPRLEGPMETCKGFVRLDSPTLRNSYPGHPDSLLIPDVDCGNLLPSPTNNDIVPPKHMLLKRATSLKPLMLDDMSPDSSSTAANLRANIRKSRSMDLRTKINAESKPVILYADMSFNQISHFEVLSTPNRFIKPFLNGLVRLDLKGNKLKEFSGVVCLELTSLKQLSLAENQLEDFPYDILKNKTLEVLNLSKNSIKDLNEQQMHHHVSLSRLELDANDLTKLPAWLDDIFPALTTLSMSQNRIALLPSKPLHLRQLRFLNLSFNKLETIPAHFLDHCLMLEKLDLTMNNLISLPGQSAKTFNRLSHIKLSHNQLKEQAPWHVPKFLLELQNLAYLDISHNKITQIPAPAMWASHCVKDLNFSHNRINKINLDESASNWRSLSHLNLMHNKIERLPKFIGHLTGLTYLNFSYNPLVEIPDEIGFLRNLLELPLDSSLTLTLDASIRDGTAQEICTFLYSKMKNSVPYLRMKLMAVGMEGRGKSSLLRALQSMKRSEIDSATVGIRIKPWYLTIPKKYQRKTWNKKTNFVLSMWDVAGQEDFHSTHQCFMTSRTLYLAVFDASKGPSELEHLRPWLLNIKASAPYSQVIIVGTHLDQIEGNKKEHLRELEVCINDFIKNPGLPTCRGSVIVSCHGKSNAIEVLREKILDTIDTCTFRAQSPMDQTVPKSYVQLEDLLVEEASNLIDAKQIPVISRRSIFKIVQDNNLQLEKQELDQAVKFLHEVGALLHFEDPSLKLSDCYFINPEWLSQMMAQVVTVKEINPFVNEQGIVHRKNLPILFRDERFPVEFIDTYLRLLQKFEVVIPLSDEEFLIPSKLPIKPSGFTNRVTKHAIYKEGNLNRYYKFNYIPVGFWGRIISRLMLFYSPLQCEADKTPLVEYWKDGIFRFWSEDKYFVVATSELHPETVEIIVPISQRGYELLGFLVDHVEALIEEWYPGLTIPDPKGKLPVERLVPCLHCASLDKKHYFTVDQCITRSNESDSIWCPSHEGEVDLKCLAPDVLFADIDGKYVLKDGDIEIKDSTKNVLDGGSFGTVYQTQCKGNRNVAVKVFKSGEAYSPHRSLRQEVTILQQLHHPSLVSMVGVILRPSRCLVLELATKGSLRKVLNRDHLSRGMQQRIASQVADGLAYLHSLNIVYRDMKPSNILIFSLSMGIPVNAKISDYGISQYITPQGLCEISGSPGYRAPEVDKGYWIYNKEADIFSFGVTLFELVTGGRKLFGKEAMYQSERDNNFVQGRGIKSMMAMGCPHWPDMQNIILNCLNFIPDKRPSAKQLAQWLSSADTLCLKQEVGVCKGQAVECMAVYQSFNREGETMELWIASGDSSGQTQMSWLTLVGDGTQVSGCRGMFLRDERVLCMCIIKDQMVIAGTQKGNIVVFDAESHEQLNTITDLGDSVLCLKMYSVDNRYLIIAGLANGHIAIFNGNDFAKTDQIRPITQMEVLQNEEGLSDSKRRHPVTSIQISRRKCYCGVGGRIAVIDPNRGHTERFISNGGEVNNIINQISIRKYIWTSSKSSSVVHCLDSTTGILRGSFDCAKVLRERYQDISQSDCRVLSLYQQSDALWIGCGGGHVIIIDPNSNFKVLAVVSRHSSAVRCIIGASGNDEGKPVSLVLTGGIGFSERAQKVGTCDSNFGYVLVWQAELPQHYAYLDNLRRSRQALIES
ncbi:leucine-rich repeat serine/threonine-protein kinase 2-like isoform X2 [Rhopilema esculentum]|uniref:leucine-rich repeat serine/threonine-protein kinase 2-like isoform X2 n=1 Tax=Rhopilema esculentum TaxID=499914 RepID=UPI0031DED461